ncbi:DUF4381 domain-containing protein [Aquabacter sp. CN5-332]|uniref:DUF4381 domain-containing protein n=1 Tax=Aquabacter sp. CN5-332 TaxID=3156608 RepID=UPI0032B35CE8
MPDFASPPGQQAPGATGTDPLAGLRDIHLPDAISFWPLAPGWWVVVWLVVLLLITGAILEWRRRQTLGYRAVQELKAIARDEARYADSRAVASAAAILIRRILLTKAGGPGAASLTGDGWQRFLVEGKAGVPAEIGRFIALAPYLPPGAPGGNAVAREALVTSVRRWIRGNA